MLNEMTVIFLVATTIIAAILCLIIWMGKKTAQFRLDVIKEINQVMQGSTQTTLQEMNSMKSQVQEALRTTTENLAAGIGQTGVGLKDGVNEMTNALETRLKEVGGLFREIQEGMTALKITTGEFASFGKDLRDVLLPSGERGNFGQVELEKILKDVFPPDYLKFQSPVEPGGSTQVDAAVILDRKMIPIDSKFPVADFLAIKKAVGGDKVRARNSFVKEIHRLLTDIKSKYIRPPHTFEIALMYVHSESVYQEAIRMDMGEDGADLFTVAQKNEVLLTSPQTILMHLRLIQSVIRNQHLSANISGLIGLVNNLQPSFDAVTKAFGKTKKQFQAAGENLSEAEAALIGFQHHLQRVLTISPEEMRPPRLETSAGSKPLNGAQKKARPDQ